MTEIPEVTDEQLKRAIPASLRQRLRQGRFEPGEDIAALRHFIGLTRTEFARAVEISVHTLRIVDAQSEVPPARIGREISPM